MFKCLNNKEKTIVTISFFLLLISIIIESRELFQNNSDYEIKYEYINIKDMAQAKVTTKIDNSTILDTLFAKTNNQITNTIFNDYPIFQEVNFPALNNALTTTNNSKKIWHLPTETGYITQYPRYNHVALDIGSSRSSNENIFPVANGTISGIYTDKAGAKIVTVFHNIDGKNYTSQYVHLSTYNSGLYIGKPVTINDSLGLMGTTGNSTGVHLHLAVVDCALFNEKDPNCSDLNSFFKYADTRLREGYFGLGTMMDIPESWSSR